MHELGIVFHIIRGVEEGGPQKPGEASQRGDPAAGRGVRCGGALFQDCWRWAADRSDLLRGAQLRVENIPAQTLCEDFGEIYPTVPHGKICPACGFHSRPTCCRAARCWHQGNRGVA